MLKTLLVAVAAITICTTTAQAHWDRPSCYIDVHEGCFNSGRTPCTQKEYEEWLDSCDEAYPFVVRTTPGSLTTGDQTSGGVFKRR